MPLRYEQIDDVLEKTPGSYFSFRYDDPFNAERAAPLPYLLMPLKRVLNGDIVMILDCEDNMTIKDYQFCGSEDIEVIRRWDNEQPDKMISRRLPGFNIRPYRLKATQIDPDADTQDDDHWMFKVDFHPPHERCERQYEDDEKHTEKVSRNWRNFGSEIRTVGDGIIPILFHVIAWYMTNYKYEWVPFDATTLQSLSTRIPIFLKPPYEKDILERIKGKEVAETLKQLLKRRLPYQEQNYHS
ncbi:hypothetical protein HK098_005182 [Nowakowskiella sp. JEL0407]|nr:hypothetical protein HK098_005182 [Nowakowskiella sp. JEL0407]